MTALTGLAKQRRLHIIDDLNPRTSPYHDKHAVERLLADARDAERFIIGDEASFALGRWIAGCEDMLLDHRQFAKPPFEKLYLELTIRHVHKGMNRPVSGPDNTADDRFGFLITGNRVRTCCTSLAHGPGVVGQGVWEYWLDTPENERLMSGPVQREIWARLALLLGSTTHALKDEDQRLGIAFGTRIRTAVPEVIRNIRLHTSEGAVHTKLMDLVAAAAGEIRTLWAALLLINQHRQHLRFSQMPRQSGITPKGRRIYLGHTLVQIPLHTPEEARRIFYPATRASPVGHTVRGHWVRHHLTPGCEHLWARGADDEGRIACARCRGWMRWREPFHRGDSGHGYNLHTYEVTP